MSGAQWLISVQPPYALVSEAFGAALSPDLLHKVFEALESRAVDDGAMAVAWPCVETASSSLIQVAADRGYAALYAGASARLSVQWSSFEDYLATRSKNVRRTIKAEIRALRTEWKERRALGQLWGPHIFSEEAPA